MKIQEVLLEITNEYAGHPYYVTGNALLHAMASDLSYPEQQALRVSHGVFVPSVFGLYPDWHSQNGTFPVPTLKPVERYEDLFLYRRPNHPWIYEGRPRDAFNAHSVKRHRDTLLFNDRNYIETTKREPNPDQSRSVRSGKGWLLHWYIHQENNTDVLPVDESVLDGLQLGGARNYGYGQTTVKDTRLIDIDALDYSRIEDSDGHVVELVTPFVVSSEYPRTSELDVPWWWDQDLTYRYRDEVIVEQRDRYGLSVIDHGQVTRYEGSEPVRTAKKGVGRVGNHCKYGFGEFMVRPTG